MANSLDVRRDKPASIPFSPSFTATGLSCGNAPKITIDFETRSACPIDKGAWLYSLHPSTEVMCLAYKIGDEPTKLWHPAYPHLGIEESPPPYDLFAAIALGMLVEAHNRFFEYCVWTHIMMRVFGWPPIAREQWRCSAAKAAYYSLPRALENAVAALGLPIEKDMEGSKLMKKISKPRKVLKKERAELIAKGWPPERIERTVFWHEGVDIFERLWAYCVTDVDAEHGFSEVLPDLPPMELRIWQMDQDMNLRGVKCDIPLVKQAIHLRDQEVDKLNQELSDITGEKVTAASQRSTFVEWIKEQGVDLPDTQGKTLDDFIKKKMRPDLHRAIWIVREVNRTSTAKYDAMMERADPADDRLRDLMMYHGAGTGRWSGKGVQPHNFPRGSIKDMETACWAILTGDRVTVRALYGDIMKHLSDSLRGALIASEGRDLIVADYAAIEARVVFWLAGDDTALDVFRRHEDIYMDMATGVYGYPVNNKKTQATERQFGKQGILGLGFEMGFLKFLITCRKYDIYFTEGQVRNIVGSDWHKHEQAIKKYFAGDKRRVATLRENDLSLEKNLHELILMKHTVDTYRTRYPEVTQMWRDQEEAALTAVRNPGRLIECPRGRNSWIVEHVGGAGVFLKTYLPSGKPLHYYDPKIVRKKTPWKNPDGSPVYKPCITFMGVDALTKKWVRQDTYGGKLVENITQATARELMAQAMVNADDGSLYEVLLSVHDELICEVDEGLGDLKEFEKLMAWAPGWAHGCPVEAEGWRGKRYRK
jgi:DNA polymerase